MSAASGKLRAPYGGAGHLARTLLESAKRMRSSRVAVAGMASQSAAKARRE